jgi:hypothetical protein
VSDCLRSVYVDLGAFALGLSGHGRRVRSGPARFVAARTERRSQFPPISPGPWEPT